MQLIPDEAIPQWEQREDVRLPAAVDAICPFCGRRVAFGLSWTGGLHRRAMSTESRCPACSETPVFLLVGLRPLEAGGEAQGGQLYMYPAAAVREPIAGLSEVANLPDPVKRAYVSAIATYNSREWAATALACRRTLEGITRTLLGNVPPRQSLARQLEALPQRVNLGRPVIALAQALKEGGDLGAHFELEREPNELVATMMIDLLDDLIEYLFILPARVGELDHRAG